MKSRDKKITSLLNQGVINRFKSCGYSDRAIYRASITLAALCAFTSCGNKDGETTPGEKTKQELKEELIRKLVDGKYVQRKRLEHLLLTSKRNK
jgi:hypothetical protein